jgi:hypothetical protein
MWLLELEPREWRRSASRVCTFDADWGGAAPLRLRRSDPAVTDRWLAPRRSGSPEAAELPEALRLAAFESLRAELEKSLAAKGAQPRPLRLNALRSASRDPALRHRYAFRLTAAPPARPSPGRSRPTRWGSASPPL